MSRLTAFLDRHGVRNGRLHISPLWVRGVDRRSLLTALRDRMAGERGVVHVFGDSQSRIYVELEGAVVHTFIGVTMYRVGRDEAWFLKRLRWRLGANCTLLFVFGGVDARVHLGRIAEETGRPEAEVVQSAVDRYLDAIVQRGGRRLILVAGVMPPGANEAIIPRRHWRTQDDRVRIVRLLNAALRKGCIERGLVFVDLFSPYADEFGRHRPERLSDGIHLVKEARGPALAAVKDALSADNGFRHVR
jgi:hypothetical protein